MTPDPELIAWAFSPVGLNAIVAMLISGALFGFFIIWLSPAVSEGRTSFRYLVYVFAIFGITFFASRGVALYLDDSNLWPRNVGFSVLWVIYCISMGCGLAVRNWRKA